MKFYEGARSLDGGIVIVAGKPMPPRHGELTSRGNSPRNRRFESVSLQRRVVQTISSCHSITSSARARNRYTIGTRRLASSAWRLLALNTSGQRKNSPFASRNQPVLGGAAEIGPLMPKTAS